VRTKRAGGTLAGVMKVEMLRRDDVSEYERIRSELVNVLERMGGYEPAVDNIHIDEIARTAIDARKVEVFLDSAHATANTYSRVTDTKLKLSKIIDNAMHQLALARRDRIGRQTESSLMNELRKAMLRGLGSAEQ
jgi:hypothetical protein